MLAKSRQDGSGIVRRVSGRISTSARLVGVAVASIKPEGLSLFAHSTYSREAFPKTVEMPSRLILGW